MTPKELALELLFGAIELIGLGSFCLAVIVVSAAVKGYVL